MLRAGPRAPRLSTLLRFNHASLIVTAFPCYSETLHCDRFILNCAQLRLIFNFFLLFFSLFFTKEFYLTRESTSLSLNRYSVVRRTVWTDDRYRNGRGVMGNIFNYRVVRANSQESRAKFKIIGSMERQQLSGCISASIYFFFPFSFFRHVVTGRICRCIFQTQYSRGKSNVLL